LHLGASLSRPEITNHVTDRHPPRMPPTCPRVAETAPVDLYSNQTD
jgi:hypothetical protein